MTIIHKQLTVPYSAEQMYELVNNIGDYPHFLPWCKASEILSENADEIQARLLLAGGGFEKSFTTCNRLHPHKMIEIRLLDGPFRQLEGFWRFKSLPEQGSEVILDLEFEFTNKLLGFAFGSVFNQVATTLVDAFNQRARTLYGSSC